MSVEIIISGAAIVGVLFTGTGLIATWRRNGSQQAARDIKHAEALAIRDAVLANNQQAIIGRLDDKESGLQAVNNKIGRLATHCAVLDERVTGHDREIKELKHKP